MKFSIITAVYNRRRTVGQAVASLRAQTHTDYEHLVQDGGSTDGTLEVLHALADARTRIVSGRDDGIYYALNGALARVQGDVVGLLHSDDFYANDRVLEVVARTFANTDADAVYGDLDYVSAADETRVIRHWRSGEFNPENLRRGWMPPHPALFLRRGVVEHLGGFDTNYEIAADYDAILRYFSQDGFRAAYVPEVFVKMRLGGESNRSLRKILRKSREDYRALRTNRVGGVGALVWKNLSKIRQFCCVKRSNTVR